MTKEYERMSEVESIMERWAIGLTDRELSECFANLGAFSDTAVDTLILEAWRRIPSASHSGGIAA